MGLSKKHATSAPLVLNPDSGYITPQFHVVFDDWFATVTSSVDDLPDLHSPEWAKLFGDSSLQYPVDAFDDTPSIDNASSTAEQAALQQQEVVGRAMETAERVLVQQPKPAPIPTTQQQTPFTLPPAADAQPRYSPKTPVSSSPRMSNSSTSPEGVTTREGAALVDSTPSVEVVASELEAEPREASLSDTTGAPTGSAEELRRSTRSRRAPDLLGDWDFHYSIPSASISNFGVFEPGAWKATSDPDTLTWNEMMAAPDRDKFLDAIQVEIDALEKNDTWDEVPITDAKGRIVPGTWTFKRKRTPDGIVYRWKARYCVRGDLQDVAEDEETYAPVAAFTTVRFFMVFTMVMSWYSCSVDWTNAFAQAPLAKHIWIHVPRGFRSTLPGKACLRLKKSLYGTTIAPRAWYLHLMDTLKDMGFVPSAYDPCLMYKPDHLLVLYVDDACLSCAREQDLDAFVLSLRDRGFALQREASLSEYLGIKYEDHGDGAVHASQRGLIKKLLATSGMEDCKPIATPAAPAGLGSDPEGAPMSEKWSYRSLCGMLLFLSGNTRPDIAMAVSQVCRFTHAPKQSHAMAVKRILRYLKGTADYGTIARPIKDSLALDNYADADFAGLYGTEPQASADSARSRIGYIIFFNGVPLVWKSQLCSEITTSTLHSEYIALSTSLRVQLVLKRMIEEVSKGLNLSEALRGTVTCRAFEDNQGALSSLQQAAPVESHSTL